MTRLLVLLCLLLLAVPAMAVAQDPDEPTIEQEADPGVVDDPEDPVDDEPGDDEILQNQIPDGDTNYCEGDGDYAYDGDYTYCYPSVPNPQEDGTGGEEEKGDGKTGPGAVAPDNVAGASLGSSLPRTGGEPLVLALMGIALISIGSGGRLIFSRR